VQLDITDVLAGRVDVLQHLRSIPDATIARMQATIAAEVHALHYGFDDTPGDAFDVGLARLLEAIEKKRPWYSFT
jgi:hypothetical protein